jgi:hypothetical protein
VGTVTLATLDVRFAVKSAQFDLKIPLSTIAQIACVSAGTLSQLMKRENLRLPGDAEYRIRRAVEDLRELVRYADPIPVDMRGDPDKLERCVHLLRDKKLHVAIFTSDEPVAIPDEPEAPKAAQDFVSQ